MFKLESSVRWTTFLSIVMLC